MVEGAQSKMNVFQYIFITLSLPLSLSISISIPSLALSLSLSLSISLYLAACGGWLLAVLPGRPRPFGSAPRLQAGAAPCAARGYGWGGAGCGHG